MRLTVDQVSDLTGLPVPTIRVYASRLKLGTRIGNNRFFSQADVQRILKGKRPETEKKAVKASPKKAAKKPAKKAAKTSKAKTAKARPAAASAKPAAKPASKPAAKPAAKSAQKAPAPAAPAAKSARPSFWSRLFGGGSPKKKVDLMAAKTTK